MWARGSRAEPDGSWPPEWAQHTAGFGTHTSGWGTPISVRPQPYWISPWKCLFLSPSHLDTSRPLISSLFIKESPEETPPGLWLEGPCSQEGKAEGKIRSRRNIIFFTCGPESLKWCENLPSVLRDCHTESAIQFPFFSSIWLTPAAEPQRTHQVGSDCYAFFLGIPSCANSTAMRYCFCSVTSFFFFVYIVLSRPLWLYSTQNINITIRKKKYGIGNNCISRKPLQYGSHEVFFF